MSRRRMALVVLGIISAFLTAGQSRAETPSKAALVAELLNRGEKRLPDALQTATELYDLYREESPVDVRADYAFALVLARQQQHDRASELLDQLVARSSGETCLLAQRLRLSVLLQRKVYPKALQQAMPQTCILFTEKGTVR